MRPVPPGSRPGRWPSLRRRPAVRRPRPTLTAVPEMNAAVPADPGRRIWQGLSAALAVTWLVTLGGVAARAWPASPQRYGSSARQSMPPGPPRNTAAARRRVQEACRAASPRAARDALLDWGRSGLARISSPRPRRSRGTGRRRSGRRGNRSPRRSSRSTGHCGRPKTVAGPENLWPPDFPREIGQPPSRRRADTSDGLPSLHPA